MEEAEVLISPTWLVHCRPTIAGVVWKGPIRPFLVCARKSYFAFALISVTHDFRDRRGTVSLAEKNHV